MPLAVVLGATGVQGGGVVQALLKDGGWKVRALSRKTDSESAKSLTGQGVEVVAADVNDQQSLEKAFSGADVIFAVTAYWPSAFTLGRDGAGEEETQQHKNIFAAAGKTSTLKHLILSTLPAAARISGDQLKCPHYDYKQVAWEWAERNTPDVLKITTRYWPGWYTSNLKNYPSFTPLRIPGSPSGGYILALPSKPNGILPITGDAEVNTGVIVAAIIKAGAKAHGKIINGITEYLPMTEVVKAIGKALGKPCVYAELSDEAAGELWGPVLGSEVASQLRWSEKYPNWGWLTEGKELTLQELGVEKNCVGFAQALEQLKEDIGGKN